MTLGLGLAGTLDPGAAPDRAEGPVRWKCALVNNMPDAAFCATERQFLSLLRHLVQLLRSILITHPAEQALGLVQPIGSAALSRVILLRVAVLRRRCFAHVIGGLRQAFQGLLNPRILLRFGALALLARTGAGTRTAGTGAR